MEPAKVYFSDLRTDEVSTLEKLHRLMKAAGFDQIDFKDTSRVISPLPVDTG